MAEVKIDKSVTFEAALEELEALLREMESGKKPLEELISSFERGMALSKYCRGKLEALEKRIEILTADGGWEEFAPPEAPDGAPRR